MAIDNDKINGYQYPSDYPEEQKKWDELSQKILKDVEVFDSEINSQIKTPSTLGGVLSSMSAVQKQAGMDPSPTIETFYTHDPYGDPNMFIDRYQAFPAFKKLGFSPYRNNEALYNQAVSGANEWARTLKAFNHLTWIALQQNSFIASGWGDNERSKELASEYNYWNAIGMSSKEGANAFIQNLVVTYGSTAAVFVKMAAEEIATSIILGVCTGGAGAIAEGANASVRFGKLFKSLKNILNAGRSLSRDLKGGWRAVEIASDFIAPGAVRYGRSAANLFKQGKYLKGVVSTAASLYSPVRSWKITQSEALLEANLAAEQYVMDLYHSGKSFTDDEINKIKITAQAISNDVFWKNIPAIYASNLVIFNSLIMPSFVRWGSKTFNKTFKTLGKLPERITEGSKRGNAMYKVYKNGKAIIKPRSEYAMKGIPLMLGYGALQGTKMFLAGSVEGLQENVQDIIAIGTRKYYEDLYEDDNRFKELYGAYLDGFGVTDVNMGYNSIALDNQFTKQGFETFITGTLMGGPTAAVSATFKAGASGVNRLSDKVKLNNIKKKYGEDSDEYKSELSKYNYKYNVNNVNKDRWQKIYQNAYDDPYNFFNKNLESMVLIEGISDDATEESEKYNKKILEEVDEKKKVELTKERDEYLERAKRRQWGVIFRTMSSNGTLDGLINDLRIMRDSELDEMETVSSFAGSGLSRSEIQKNIDDCIDMAERTRDLYDNYTASMNPEDDIKKLIRQFGCKSVQEFKDKYSDNDEMMGLLHYELIKQIAYKDAIDDILLYSEELLETDKNKKSILDKFNSYVSDLNKKVSKTDLVSTDISSLLSDNTIRDLILSNKSLIESIKGEISVMEDEKERNALKNRVDELQRKNKALSDIVTMFNSKDISVENFNSSISQYLDEYLGTNKELNDIKNILKDYFNNYKEHKNIYDVLVAYTNPNNFSAIVNSKAEEMYKIFERRSQIINDSLAKNTGNEVVNELINRLYDKGYAIDVESANNILNKNGNITIYKINDRSFNKKNVKGADGKVMSVMTYGNSKEAFANSFDYKLHPLGREYHNVIKGISNYLKTQGYDTTNLKFGLGDTSEIVEAVGTNAEEVNSVTDNTVEGIEREMIGNDTDVLEVFQNYSDKQSAHNMNEALSKIDERLSDNNVFKELIKLLTDFNNKNKVQFLFDSNYKINRPYIIRQNTIIIDTRYFDDKYRSQHTNEGFGMAMLRANLEMMIHKELSKDSNKELALDLAHALGIDVEDTFTGEDTERIIQGISTLMLRDTYSGTNITDRKVSDTLTRKLDETDPFYKFFDVLTSEASNNKSKEGVLDAISWLFKNVGKFVAPNPNTGTTAGTQQTQQEREVKNTITEPLSNITDITRNRINVPYDQLSTMEKYIILSDSGMNVNGNVNQWLTLHGNEESYRKDFDNIQKRKKEFELHQKISPKDSDLTNPEIRPEELEREQTELKNKIGNKSGIQYIYIDYLGISDEDIREYNSQIIDSNIFGGEQSNINSSVSAVTKLKEKFGIGTQNELVTYDDEKHQYTFTSIDGKSVNADTSASGFVDYLINILGGKVEESTDDTISTVYGNIFDAAMRDYMQTGTLSDDVFDLIYHNGKSLNNTSGSTEDIAERNSIKNNIANTLIGTMHDIRNKLMEKIAGKDYDASKFSFNTDELRYVARVNIKGSDGSLRSFIVGMSHDMVVEYNGKTYVVDFKTRGGDNGITSDVKNHYNLQTYLYSKAIESSTDKKVDGRFIILKNLTETYDGDNVGPDNIEIAFGNKKYDVIEFTEEPSITVNKVKYTVDSVENVTDIEDISFDERKRNIVNSFNNLDHFDIDLLNVLVSDMTDEQKLEVYNSILDNAKYKRRINQNIPRIAMYVDESGITHYVTWSSNSNELIPDNSVFYKNKPLAIGIIMEIAKITNAQQEVTEEVTVTNNNSLSQYIDMMNEVKKTNEDFDENKLRELLKEHCK